MKRNLVLVAALAAAGTGFGVGFTGCGGESGLEGNALCTTQVYDPVTGMHRDFGATGVAKSLEAMLETTASFVRTANSIDGGFYTECKAMGAELGIPAAELEQPAPGQGAATKGAYACKRVAREIETILKANLRAQAQLSIVYKPAVCTVNAMARLQCIQTCETRTVQVTEVMCKPGKIYYPTCMGTCDLECTGSCSGTCTGSCSAGCTGTCEGTCNGDCAGTCSLKNAEGKCVGRCDGTCTGTCSGKCTGSCGGTCSGGCTANCMGGCRGSCSAGGVEPPVCEEVVYDQQVQECQTTCDARARYEAMCTPAELTVAVDASLMVDPAKVMAVVSTLRAHYPAILTLSKRAGLAASETTSAYATAVGNLAQRVGELGTQAVACAASAVSATAAAFASVTASVSVSVEVSASVSVAGTASGSAGTQ